jgi:hypothetical protein
MTFEFSRGDLKAADLQNFLQIYRNPLSMINKINDEERSVYLESIDDEYIVILVYDDFISRANPPG